jgi:hypothetical protein
MAGRPVSGKYCAKLTEEARRRTRQIGSMRFVMDEKGITLEIVRENDQKRKGEISEKTIRNGRRSPKSPGGIGFDLRWESRGGTATSPLR